MGELVAEQPCDNAGWPIDVDDSHVVCPSVKVKNGNGKNDHGKNGKGKLGNCLPLGLMYWSIVIMLDALEYHFGVCAFVVCNNDVLCIRPVW